ncbi:outer membrane beta-barrel family protein [Lewinella cohaerens]|uniref:outer membrane beta-barrel family protein n=1 Tax=Lewinella cohaerens TaxID=70995 RepID=UPI0003A01291|nr:outer membrane beta-barrel family protein [Lewinella cohaerens]
MMKTLTFWLTGLLLLPLFVFAQPPGGRPGGGRPGGGPQLELADGTGAVLGRVADEQTEEAILLANVLVYQGGTTDLITGTTTDERGLFVIKDLPYGDYDLEISYLGYASFKQTGIQLNAEQRMGRLGQVLLGAGANNLDEIEVTAERAAVEFGLDRKVFNVEQDIASSGGTAEDLLRNIPSVTVDLDGNISLRGSSNIRILINGKPSALTGLDRQGFLQQLAAGTIESIEVLTNPSAKYDPEGMGGIINIITKQQNKQGFNIQTSINIGTNDKYNGNVNLNYRVGKFNIQTGYSYNNDDRWFQGMLYRTTMTTDTTWIQDQDIRGDRNRLSHTFQGGVEYFVGPRSSISLRGNYSDRSGENTSNRDNLFLGGNDEFLYRSLRREVGAETSDSWELNLDYRQRFREKGRELTLSAQHSEQEEMENENFFEDFFAEDGSIFDMDRQLNPQPQGNDVWLFQGDYTHPLSESTTLETGSRVTLRGVSIDNQLFDFDPAVNDFVFLESFSNFFSYQEDVYAAYGILKGSFGDNWEWQAGLRAEQTYTSAELIEPTKEVYPNDYFSLFPSAFLTYQLSDRSSVQLNYSRRINRPRFRSLNPFIDFGDPLNPRGGNPFLLPEYTNSYEFNYLRSSEKGSVTLGGYWRETTDMITRIIIPDPATGVNLRTSTNLASGRNYGVEVIGTIRPVDKLQLVISGNGYRTEVDSDDLESDLDAAGYQFSGRMQASYTLFKDLGVQLTGFYRSAGVRPQGEMRAFGSVDLGFRQKVLKGKGTITLRASDLFKTRKFSFLTISEGITSDATYQRESRIVYLGFNYSLRQDKRQRSRGDREGGGMDDDDF